MEIKDIQGLEKNKLYLINGHGAFTQEDIEAIQKEFQTNGIKAIITNSLVSVAKIGITGTDELKHLILDTVIEELTTPRLRNVNLKRG